MTPRCVGCRLKPRLTAWNLQLAEARRHQQDRLLLRQPATRLPSRPLRSAGSGPAAVPAQAQHQKSLGRGPKGGGGGGLRRGGQRCLLRIGCENAHQNTGSFSFYLASSPVLRRRLPLAVRVHARSRSGPRKPRAANGQRARRPQGTQTVFLKLELSHFKEFVT